MKCRIGKFQGLVPQSADDLTAIKAPPQIISVGEAAFLAGVSDRTIKRWAAAIDGLAVKRVGRWVIYRKNLLAILSAGLERYREQSGDARALKASQSQATPEAGQNGQIGQIGHAGSE
jgi:hypothetical protein